MPVGQTYNIKQYLDFPISEYEARFSRAQALMAEAGIDALLITTPQNLRYFSGLNTVLYLTTLRPITMLLPAARGAEPVMVVPEVLEATCLATTWVEDIRINAECYGKTPSEVLEVLGETVRNLGLDSKCIGMEFGGGHYLAIEQQQLGKLHASLPSVEWRDATDLIWELRMVKSPLEIEALRTACEISGMGVEAGFRALRPGMTERELYSVITAT